MNDQEILDRAERAARSLVGPDDAYEALLRRRDRERRNQRIRAGVIGVAVFVASVWFVRDITSLDSAPTVVPGAESTGPTVTGSTVTNPTGDAADFGGLASEGAEPSSPEQGELVAGIDQLHEGAVYVYADGRVISWSEMGSGPEGVREQRLTPDGVELLLSELRSTGLFDHDLELDSGEVVSNALTAFVRQGDRFVHVNWGPDAARPTPEQANALQQVDRLLWDSGSLVPASAWEDPTLRPYVPYRFAICQSIGTSSDLPAAAADLLGGNLRTFEPGAWTAPWGNGRSDCYDVTTEEARAVAGILAGAGFTEAGQDFSTAGATYELGSQEESAHGDPLAVLSFFPVFPHGSYAAHWLG